MPDPTPAPANPMGGIVKSLPLDMMFGAPLDAAIKAQSNSALATVDYMKKIGFDPQGNLITVRSQYTQILNDAQGNPQKAVQRIIDAPLLALVPVPALQIKTVDIGFELTVETSESSSSSTEASGSVSGSVGFAFWKASFSASMSHKSEQTRKTDTRARYTVNIHAEQADPPEGFKRIIDALTNAMTQPVDKDVADKLTQKAA